jgi:hypothetical protein
MKKTSSGFAAVEGIVAAAILAAIVVVGYYVVKINNTHIPTISANSSTKTPTSPPVTTPTAPTINNASQLNSAMTALNQTSVSSNNVDNNQLSTESAAF